METKKKKTETKMWRNKHVKNCKVAKPVVDSCDDKSESQKHNISHS